jgi:hypothetical protein
MDAFGKRVSFMHVAHDGWDKKAILGVCIFFVSPLTGEIFMACVGLVEEEGKKAAVLAPQILELLEMRVGFEQDDLLSSINDTTPSSVKLGRDVVKRRNGKQPCRKFVDSSRRCYWSG